MRRYKRFISAWCCAFLVFFALHVVIWKLYTEDLLTEKHDGGDLARVAYLWDLKQPRKDQQTLPYKHILFEEGMQRAIDMITVGDSFSNGMGGGLNPYYQDYIATFNKMQVLALPSYPTSDVVGFASPLSTLMVLYNTGFLDRYRPKYILVQSVERFSIERMSKPLNQITGHTDDYAKILAYYERIKSKPKMPTVNFISTANFKTLYYMYQYRQKKIARENIRMFRLVAPLFSADDGKTLLVLPDEVSNISKITGPNVALMNENLNEVARMLKRKGITLCFMPVVDKYDLYYPWIQNRQALPQSQFFEELRTLPKDYLFIDTKKILRQELEKGTRDLYFPDDTHWSWRASEAIFKQVRFTMEGQ